MTFWLITLDDSDADDTKHDYDHRDHQDDYERDPFSYFFVQMNDPSDDSDILLLNEYTHDVYDGWCRWLWMKSDRGRHQE